MFELSSSMDVRNRLRIYFEDMIPRCFSLRCTPRLPDVTAEEAFDVLTDLVEGAGGNVFLFGPHKTTPGYDWVVVSSVELLPRDIINPNEARLILLQYRGNPFQETGRIPATGTRSTTT